MTGVLHMKAVLQKIRIIVMAVLVLTLIAALLYNVRSNIRISKTNFPDKNFRRYVSDYFDLNGDNYLSEADLNSYPETIDVSGKSISDLKGIEYFTNLISLDCSGNKLTSLDLSCNPALKAVNCQSNRITSLDLSNKPALESLDCSDNQLVSLDLSNDTALVTVSCFNNCLTELDAANAAALTYLDCYDNQLARLDLGSNSALETLN